MTAPTPGHPTATWSVELNADCPKCEKFVNLLDYADFWEWHSKIEIGEHGTDRSSDVKVNCPECGHEWEVDLGY